MAKSKLGVFVGIPNRGLSAAEFWIHLRKVVQGFPVGLDWTFGNPTKWMRKPVAEARTLIVRQAIAQKARWLFFLDDDVIPPKAVLKLLLEHDDPIVTGVYWTKTDSPEPIIIKERGYGHYKDWEMGDYFPIWAAGLGCCLIKVEVFEKIPEPWFKWNWMEKEGEVVTTMNAGEDYYFYNHAAEHGYPVMCDTRILCDHIDPITGDMSPGAKVLNNFMITEDKIAKWKADPSTIPDLPPALSAHVVKAREEAEKKRQVWAGVPGERLAIGQRPSGDDFKFVSHDPSESPDIHCDLDKDKLPLRARTVGMISMKFAFEYFEDPVKVMEELWRVCKKNALVEVVAIYGNTSRSIGNPFQKHFVNETSFHYYSKQARDQYGMPWTPQCDFEIVAIEPVPEPVWIGKGEKQSEFAIHHYWNVGHHVRAVLKAVK